MIRSNKVFRCEICDKTYHYLKKLQNHSLKKHNYELNICEEQTLTFANHQLIDVKQGTIKESFCEICETFLSNDWTLKWHIITEHKNSADLQKCHLCEK